MTELSENIFINDIEIIVKEFPLQNTYNLSFANLDQFISIQTILSFSNNKRIITEVVPLYGYNEESKDLILKNLTTWSKEIISKEIKDARNHIQKFINKYPFSTSPLLTAIDLLEFPLQEIDHKSLNYVTPTSTQKIEEFKQLLSNLDTTIKVKLTGNPSLDIDCIETIKLELSSYNKKIRFDANQAYTFNDAKIFFEYLSSNHLENKIQYIEQPLPVGKETEMGLLRKEYPQIEIMLDESIINHDDLALANNNSINFIKLKLFKQGGIHELISIAKQAKKIGIKVILGNGVATNISNYIENEIYYTDKDLFLLPLESNGFMKTK